MELLSLISAFQALLIEAACLFWNVGDEFVDGDHINGFGKEPTLCLGDFAGVVALNDKSFM